VDLTTPALVAIAGAIVAFFPRFVLRLLVRLERALGRADGLRNEARATLLVRVGGGLVAAVAGLELLLRAM